MVCLASNVSSVSFCLKINGRSCHFGGIENSLIESVKASKSCKLEEDSLILSFTIPIMLGSEWVSGFSEKLMWRKFLTLQYLNIRGILKILRKFWCCSQIFNTKKSAHIEVALTIFSLDYNCLTQKDQLRLIGPQLKEQYDRTKSERFSNFFFPLNS